MTRQKTGGRKAGTPNKTTHIIESYQNTIRAQCDELDSQSKRLVRQADNVAGLMAEVVDLRAYVEQAEAALQLFQDMPWYRKAFFTIR